jgi:hypothetical protein
MMPTNDKREAARLRKQKSRARRKQFDMKVIEVPLSATQRKTLQHTCTVRGGITGPYTHGEYIAALIEADAKRLADELAALAPCDKCKSPLPEGCGGLLKGQTECFHHTRARSLMV